MTLSIDKQLNIPIYKQIINGFMKAVEEKTLSVGIQIPSINQVAKEYGISRDTVVKAYDLLRKKGIIDSVHGKAFYISTNTIDIKQHVLLIMDEMNVYKDLILQSLKSTLEKTHYLDIVFHHNNANLLDVIINSYRKKVDYFLIIPLKNKDCSHDFFQKFNIKNLLFLDRKISGLPYNAVYQDFTTGVYESLNGKASAFQKYNGFTYIDTSGDKIGEEIAAGIKMFTKESGLKYTKSEGIQIQKDEIYLVRMDHDLVRLIKTAENNGYRIGRDIGIISYNDTPIKEILRGGISVITTDFSKMGRIAGEMIIKGKTENRLIESHIILRASL